MPGSEGLSYADFVLRCFGAGASALLALLVARERSGDWAGRMAALFLAGVACHLLCPLLGSPPARSVYAALVLTGCLSVPGLFWAFTDAVFLERFRWRVWHTAVVLALIAAGFAHLWGPAPGIRNAAEVGFRALSLGTVAIALWRVHAGGRSDLVAQRRRYRTLLLAVSGAYVLVVVAVELYLHGRQPPAAVSLLHAAGVTALAIAAALHFLRLRGGAFWAPAPDVSAVPQPQDDPLLTRLQAALERDAVHRTEGLTLAQLAAQLDIPEYRLRELINTRLGYRNFSDFLNRRRVADACDRLRDPAYRQLPVLSIALDLGYRSIGPFNRAFKDITGVTPTQYRREALSGTGASTEISA